jgi:sugar phosphate isomerase/epimerase
MPNTNTGSQIACQMYTLREFTKTPADIARTLARVKKIGYDAIQVSAFGPIEPKELASILRNEGLTCCATHASLEKMRDQTQQVIDEHKLWDCKYTAIGGYFNRQAKAEEWLSFAKEYSGIAQKFTAAGMSLGYHNHNHELIKHENGKTALQMLVENCSPKVWFEIDTYWIVAGGGDPIAWINEVKGRIPCVHFKDMAVKFEDRAQLMAEVGEGNLNWPGIVKACKEAGVEWYIVEQDNCYGKDPFECVATSLRNLRGMGLR